MIISRIFKKNIHINTHASVRTDTCAMRGVTLFEVLLYIALFTIISFGTVPAYILVSKSINAIQVHAQETELNFLIYEILRHGFDTFGPQYKVSSDDFKRVLKYYPDFSIEDLTFKIDRDMYSIAQTSAQVAKVSFTLRSKMYPNERNKKHTLVIYLI